MLRGLSPSVIDDDVIEEIELMINYFCKYHLLYESKKKVAIDEQLFDRTCSEFETLRSKYKVPGRFFYNKFKRRDGIGISKG
ncbi:MAG TPA: hypothetical protein VK666_07780, partial [Chryseolinea sp.]|nr:hypothetical protein [Chryseolinea sp.]